MTAMDPMSSAIASPSSKTFRELGTRSPSRASTPTAKAMSVAIGMPQPRAPSPPALKARKSAAGRTMPPSAAMAGRATSRDSESWPTDELALDLQAHNEEEQRHQPVVDPVAEVLGDVERADSNGEDRVPTGPRRTATTASSPTPVRPRSRREQHAAGRLDLQEARHGRRNDAREKLVAAEKGRTIRRGQLVAPGSTATCRPDFPAHRW